MDGNQANSLNAYIQQCLAAGHTPQQIRRTLLDAGWPSETVDASLGSMLSGPRLQPYQPSGPHSIQPQAQPKLGLLSRLRMSITSPDSLYTALKDEKGFEQPVKFFLIIVFINMIFINLFIFTLLYINASAFNLPISGFDLGMGAIVSLVLDSIFSANIFVIISIGLVFVGAAILHVFAKLLGCKNGYQNTFKAVVYAQSPLMFTFPAAFLYFVNPFIFLGVSLIISLWLLILQVLSLARFHDISAGRAFLILVVMGIVTLVVAAAISFMLLSVFLLGMFNPASFGDERVTGFTGILRPDEFSLDRMGNLEMTISNRSPGEIEILEVQATSGDATDSYRSDDLLVIEGGGRERLTGINLGPHQPGSAYFVEITIVYTQYEMMHNEVGTISGTVA